MIRRLPILLMACVLVLPGCGQDESVATTPEAAPSYLLQTDLADAISIKAAREMEAGSEIAVFGRVQELNRDGYAILYLVDDSLAYCGRGEEDCGCTTPWDYCCDEPAMLEARLPIELRTKQGKIVKSEELGLRLLDLVSAKGVLEKTDEGGLLLVVTDGWYRRERPSIPEGVTWPAN